MFRKILIPVAFVVLALLGSIPVIQAVARDEGVNANAAAAGQQAAVPAVTFTLVEIPAHQPAGQRSTELPRDILPTASRTPAPERTGTARFAKPLSTKEPEAAGTAALRVTMEPAATQAPTRLPPEQWKNWPVLSLTVSDEMREVYRRGINNGNNPHAFSILGDCQSQPDVFMGVYESNPELARPLSSHLRETIRQFSGSFNRRSPTIKDGMTEGALLFYLWNDNPEKKCKHGETPIDCELRTHRPSIVFFHVGTHWEARNERYTRIIIEKVLEHGAIPVMVTKADNRELDERVNETITRLAAEYDLPLWNFWASVQDLPHHGMVPGSDMYLNKEGLEAHRLGALEALDVVWRAASGE